MKSYGHPMQDKLLFFIHVCRNQVLLELTVVAFTCQNAKIDKKKFTVKLTIVFEIKQHYNAVQICSTAYPEAKNLQPVGKSTNCHFSMWMLYFSC